MIIRNKTMLLAAALGTLLLTNASQAAVTITFTEVGPDVVATYSGSLTTPSIPFDYVSYMFFPDGIYLSPDSFYWQDTDNQLSGWGGGIAVLHPSVSTLIFGQSPGLGFGFVNNNDLVVPDHVGPGQVYSPIGSVLFAGNTLVSLGVSGFDNTLAYTAVNGEQIFYTTVVPEPTVGVLWGLGMSAFLIRRRRRN
jgi:hypothetical protein